VSSLADFSQQLAVRESASVGSVVGLVDNGCLVGVLDRVPVNAVVGSIELAFQKPRVVSVREGAGVNCLEVSLPCQELSSLLRPELLGLSNGFLI